VRFSPRSIFFSVVALGLPFAVVVGWTLGTPAPAPPPVSAPGGAGGLGAAPPRATTPATSSVIDWSPRPPEPVAAESSLLGAPVASTAPSGSVPSVIITSGSPDPTLTLLPPVPTPTSIITTPPAPSATVPSTSTEPDTSGLGAARLIRGS
jgi:hypothetical protein